jgi:hypothetical protein
VAADGLRRAQERGRLGRGASAFIGAAVRIRLSVDNASNVRVFPQLGTRTMHVTNALRMTPPQFGDSQPSNVTRTMEASRGTCWHA